MRASDAQPQSSDKTDDQHLLLIGALARPTWLRKGSLLHNEWLVGTDDPQKRRRSDALVNFDVVVGPGTRLPDYRNDLITAKLLAYWSMSSSDGWITSPLVLSMFVRNYIHFVRWRRHHQVSRNSDLTPERLEELIRSIGERGIKDLFPLTDAMQAYKSSIKAGERDLPSYEKGNRKYLARNVVMEAIGVSDTSLAPQYIIDDLDALAREYGLNARPTLKGSDDFAISDPIDPSETVQVVSGRRLSADLSDRWERKRLSSQRIVAFLKPISELYRLRDRLSHDKIDFDPFPAERTPFSIAQAFGRPGDGRTFTAPPLQICHLVDQSLRWILDYFPDIVRFVEEVQAAILSDEFRNSWNPHGLAMQRVAATFVPKYSQNASGSPWPIHGAYFFAAAKKQHQRRGPALRPVLFEYLPIACMVVIATFSARRNEEIGSLRAECISFDEDGEPWLETYIEKTIRDFDKIPVPFSVVRAVEVLRWLSAARRQRTNSSWLFEFDEMIDCRSHLARRTGQAREKQSGATISVYRGLDRFSEFVSVPLLGNGERWIPKPHEFRRFFGVTYYNYFRFAHLTALSNFFRHHDPDMTRRYVTEASRGDFLQRKEDQRAQVKRGAREATLSNAQRLKDFESESLLYRIGRYRDIALGRARASGFGGEALTSELNAMVLAAKLELDLSPDDNLPGERLDKLLLNFSSERRLEPNRLGHSDCKCGGDTQDLRAAECLSARQNDLSSDAMAHDSIMFSAPDSRYAADYLCSKCPHNVQFAEHKGYWDNVVETEKGQRKCALGPLLQALSSERQEMATGHLERCHGSPPSADQDVQQSTPRGARWQPRVLKITHRLPSRTKDGKNRSRSRVTRAKNRPT